MLNKFRTKLLTLLAIQSICLLFSSAVAQEGASGVVVDYQKEGLSFSAVFPENWTVEKDVNGFELFAEPTEKKEPTASNPVVADPNLSIATSRNPMPIDEEALEVYENQMKTGLTQAVGEKAGLDIFLKRVVDLTDTRKGLLYYLKYKKGDFDIYNAVLVLSTDTHLFRVTLTDYEVGFDSNLETLFPFMAAIDVGQGHVVRDSLIVVLSPWLAGALAFFVLVFAIHMLRHRVSQGKLSGALDESIQEQSTARVPFWKPIFFRGSEKEEDYDSEFRETSNQSRYGDQDDFTEVPLSEAMGSGSFPSMSSTGNAGSVTDPETEVSQISSQYQNTSFSQIASEAPAQSSVEAAPPPPAPPPAPPRAEAQSFPKPPPPAPKVSEAPAAPPLPAPKSAAASSETPRSAAAKQSEFSLDDEESTQRSRIDKLPISESPESRHQKSQQPQSAAKSSAFGLDFTSAEDHDESDDV